MSLVRIQNVMSNELSKRVFLSRPPEPPFEYLLNDPTDSIFIGTTKLFGVPFTWTFATLTNPHLAVVGITGAGKSFFVKTFLIRASYIWNTNAIIIDWAGEYKAWVKQSGGTVISLSKGDYINIMDLSGMKPIDRVKQIMNSLDILTDVGDYPEQRRLTSEAMEQAYVNAGFVLSSIPEEGRESPSLKEVTTLLEEKLEDGSYEYPAELENALYRLRQFTREGEDYFARKSTIDIGKLATSGLVALDLSSLPDEKFRALAAMFILQTLKEKMRAEGWSSVKGLRAIVVLDEAWKVASDDRSDAITIVREGRKYQFGLIVASQNPTDVNEAIFSNVGTTVMLRIRFEKFMNYLQGSLNFSNFMRSAIGKLGVGQAAFDMSFHAAVQFPDVFLLERIIGEEPLDVYTINLSEILTQSELADASIQKEYYIERIDFNSKLIEAGISSDVILSILSDLDKKDRITDIRDLVRLMMKKGVSRDVVVVFLRGMKMIDTTITRIFSYI